jgi:hypothetical protein
MMRDELWRLIRLKVTNVLNESNSNELHSTVLLLKMMKSQV